MGRRARERERIDPMRLHVRHGHLREHLARYRLARALLTGRVLDAGCGTGYGSAMLSAAPQVTEVVGIDRDRETVEQARERYGAPGLRFAVGDLLSPAISALGLFDGIACLEVLEHLSEPEELLRRMDHCLAPGGRLIVSTPLGLGRERPSAQPFHHFQLRRCEFETMLRARFSYRLFGQKGETIEAWRPGMRYFLILALCRSRCERSGSQGAAMDGNTG
jgi:2-polyprenyl-3-methyl-5-hydroxy-6-metoxy-1,4-benzoquinol methylase